MNTNPITFNILIIIPASRSVLLILFIKNSFESLSKISSTLTLNAFDIFFNCSGLGVVSPNSQLEIVCLVTSTFSPNCSCESPFFFLNCKILSPKFILFLLSQKLYTISI